jgi:hypothetical protein
VSLVTEGFAGEGVTAVIPVLDEHNGDWDVLYPFSQVCFYLESFPIYTPADLS